MFRNANPRTVRVGALGPVSLAPGFFVYVGSAFGPGGIRARVARHARANKRAHWHIDYVRRHFALEEVWLTTAPVRREHDWAHRLGRHLESAVPRFGASDCRCASHLFFSGERPDPGLVAGDILLFRPKAAR